MKIIKLFTLLLSFQLALGCSGMNRTAKGGMIGVGAGGVIGGIIGSRAGNTAVGAIIGAAVGGASGAAIGRYMDKQAADLQRDLKNAKVERVGEGIKITFASGILFDSDSTQLKNDSKSNLTELAHTLNKYPDTNVIIEGHTDSFGDPTYNEQLSQRRADAVKTWLVANMGIAPERIQTKGYGRSKLIVSADHSIEEQAPNRRVEIVIKTNREK